jgi:hypothetical protein
VRDYNVFVKAVALYKAYCEKFEKVTITLDATGSFFEAICLPDGTSVTKTLFLYTVLTKANVNLKSATVCQMVTDSHSSKPILDGLQKWLQAAKMML